MPSRHRGSSLSDALTLERSEEGALVISSINKSDPTDQGLSEGDEILGATINFNDLSKEEVLQVLKLMAPFDDKLHMVTRSSRSRSRSLDNLDQFAKTPKTMLKDSYSKLYNAKIKKFMKNNLLGEKTSLEGNVTAPPPPPAKVNLRQDSDLPRFGVDFGLLKSKTLSTDHKTDAQLGDAGHLSYGRNMNLPPLGVGSNGTALFGAQVPSLRVDTKSPQLDAPDFHLPGTVPVEPAVDTTASVQLADGPSVDFAMPNRDRPPFGLNGNLDAPDVGLDSKGPEINTPDVDAPDVPSGKFRLKSSKRLKTPDLNVDNPESYADYPNFRLSGKSPDIDLDMPDVPGISMSSREENANIDLKSPDLDMYVPSGEIALPKFGMKQSEAHVDPPDQRLKTPKIKGEIHGPGLGLPKAELKEPALAADSMSVDIKGTAGKYKAPKFRMPKFDLPKIQDVGLDGDVVEPGMQLTAPDLKAPKLDLNTQNVDLNMPSLKNKPQKFRLFGTLHSRKAVDISAGMKTPELTLKSPKIDGSVPDLTAPNMDLKTPKLDINAPNVNVGSSKGKFKIPKLKIPKFRRPNLKGSEFSGSLDGLDMDVNPANVNLQGSKPDVELPDVDYTDTFGKFQVPNMNLSDVKLSGLECDGPNLDLKSPDLDMSAPKPSGRLKTPDINMPNIDLKSPNLDLKAPKLNMDMPSGKLDMPDLHAPDWDVKAPSGKLKLPKFDLSGHLPKGPKLDLNSDLRSPDLSLNTPEMKGGIGSPDMDLSKIDLKAPKFDVNAPKLNIGSPKSRLKMPKIRIPEFGLPGLKGPEFDGSLNGPDVNLNAPNVNLRGSKPDLDIPDADVSWGKFKMPNMDLPDVDLSGPKFDGPDLDLKSPDLDMPNIDLKSPNLDLKAPKLNMDMPSGKLDMPDLHAPDWDVKAPSGKLKLPKFNLSGTLPKGPKLDFKSDLKSPDWSLNAPKITGGIEAPDMDSPKLDLGSPKTKLKMPKIKMPKLRRSSLKGPEIDGSLNGPDMNLNAPNVHFKGSKPDLDIPDADVSGSWGKFKVPNMTLPDMDLSGHKFNRPNLHLKSPDADLSGPNLNARLKTPNIDMPKVDLKSSKLDFNTPKLNMDMPSGNLDMPDLHAPDWDVKAPSGKLKMPKFDFSGTLPKGPKLDLNSELKSPDLSLNAPKIKSGIDAPDMDFPKMNFKSPKLDVNVPNVNIGSPKTKLKMPKMKMPKFHRSTLKGPEIDGSLNGPDMNLNAPNVHFKGSKPDLDIPDADVSGSWGKFKMPNMNIPDVELFGPKFDGPDLDLKSPDLDMPNIDLKSPKVDLNAPKLNMDMPSGKLDMPDLHAPDWDVKAPSGKLKLPKFDLSGHLPKGPKLDLNSDLRSPDLSLNTPEMKGGIGSPDMDLSKMNFKSPKLDVNVPNVNIGSPKTKLKMPKIKMPKFRRSSLKGPEIDGSLNGPDMNLNAPKVHFKGSKPDLDIPDADVSGSWGKFKMPNMNIPDVELFGPKFDGPDLDLKSPDLDMPNIDLKSPKVDLNAPKLNMDMPSGKLDMPDLHAPDWDVKAPSSKLKLPKFDLSGTLPKGPKLDLNTDLKAPDLSLKASKIKGGIDAPDFDVDIKSPKLDTDFPAAKIGSPKGKLKMPKLKMPKFSFPTLKGPAIDGNLHGGVDLNAPTAKLNSPKADLDIGVSGPSGKLKKPHFDMPGFGLSGPKVNGPNLDLKSPNLDILGSPDWDVKAPSGKLKFPKFNMSGTLPKGANKAIDADLNSPDLNLKAPRIKGGFDAPDLNLPNMDLRAPKLEKNTPNVNMRVPKLKMPTVNLPNLKGPEIDGKFEDPEFGMKAPKVSLRGSKPGFQMPDFDIGSPSGNLKKPNFSMKTPELNLPTVKGGIDAPTLDFPNMALKAPKVDMNTPDFNTGFPNAKIKKPIIKKPKGPRLDINGGLQSPDLSIPKVDFNGKKGTLKMPDLKAPHVSLSAPNATMPETYLSGPNVKGPGMNVTAPRVKGGARGPEFGLNVPSGNTLGPQSDFDSTDRRFKLPSLKLPQFGGPDLNKTWSDIDFTASPRSPNLDISPPNAVLNMKPPQLKGKVTGPNVSAPNTDLSMPKVVMQSPTLHHKNPDLNIDDLSLKFKPYKNRRSDNAGGTMKMPDLDIDGDVRFLPTERQSSRTRVRSSYSQADLGSVDFRRSDLNVDDFTGKNHVLRARASKMELQASGNGGQVISPSGINIDVADPRQMKGAPTTDFDLYAKVQKKKDPVPVTRATQDSRIRPSEGTDGYYVTVFPSHTQNQKKPNQKYNTLGGTGFKKSANMDLEVPGENENLKGSTFFLSNLV